MGSPQKAPAPLMKPPSVVGSLRTGDTKGAVTGVLSAAPLMETKKEKAARRLGVLRAQAPPMFLAQGSPRCAVALNRILILAPTPTPTVAVAVALKSGQPEPHAPPSPPALRPPMCQRLCPPRCAIDLEEDVHVPGQYESQPDGWNVTSLQIKPAYDREISPYCDCDGGRTPRAKITVSQEPEGEEPPPAVEDQPAGWFETSLQIEEKFPAHVTKMKGEDVRRSNSAVYNDEGEDDFSPSLDQPDGWNVTSMQLDPDRQAALKIQAIHRGSKGRSDVEVTREHA